MISDFKEKFMNETRVALISIIVENIEKTEELNKIAGFEADISTYAWPEYDESKTVDDEITLPIQFNGKLKATITISVDDDELVSV